MPFLRLLPITIVFYLFGFTVKTQLPGWKSVKCGKASLNFPGTWHMTRETRGAQVRVTLTPDSMQQLTMRMFEIIYLPMGGEHNYAWFKKNFASMLQPYVDQGGKILKTTEITFKGHTSMYAEMIASSLPVKVYGINGGSEIYLIVLTQRRYVKVADPGLERDGNGILNSIAFNE